METNKNTDWKITKEGYYEIILPEKVETRQLIDIETRIIHDFAENWGKTKILKVLIDSSNVKEIPLDVFRILNSSIGKFENIRIATYNESKEFNVVRMNFLNLYKESPNNLDFTNRDEAIKWLKNN